MSAKWHGGWDAQRAAKDSEVADQPPGARLASVEAKPKKAAKERQHAGLKKGTEVPLASLEANGKADLTSAPFDAEVGTHSGPPRKDSTEALKRNGSPV